MKMRLSFYYVGDLQEAVHIYSLFLEGTPIYRDDNWARFRLGGGDFALHLDLRLQKSMTRAQIKYGAVVSFSVEDILLALAQGRQWGFRQVGEITAQDYGKQVEVRDPWGNRLSLVEPAARV